MQRDKGWRLWSSKQQRHKQLRFSFQTWVRPGSEAPASLPAATRAQHEENQVCCWAQRRMHTQKPSTRGPEQAAAALWYRWTASSVCLVERHCFRGMAAGIRLQGGFMDGLGVGAHLTLQACERHMRSSDPLQPALLQRAPGQSSPA